MNRSKTQVKNLNIIAILKVATNLQTYRFKDLILTGIPQ